MLSTAVPPALLHDSLPHEFGCACSVHALGLFLFRLSGQRIPSFGHGRRECLYAQQRGPAKRRRCCVGAMFDFELLSLLSPSQLPQEALRVLLGLSRSGEVG